MSDKVPGISCAVPMGTVVAYLLSEASVPPGWLLCDGRRIPPKYQDLITALGSLYTPNLAGRALVGTGAPANAQQSDGLVPDFPNGWNLSSGDTGGEFRHVLTQAEMPEHTHKYDGVYSYDIYNQDGNDVHLMCKNDTASISTPAGGNVPHNIMQPYYAVNFIIFSGQTD